MQALDLRSDRPHEFEGRSIELGGREYIIGPRWREGTQGYAHALTNRLSGLSLHVLQIRREYLEQPARARDASHQKATLTAQVRAQEMRDHAAATAALLRAFDVCHGTIELHEWEVASRRDGPLADAQRLAQSSKWEAAIATLNEHLASAPNDTAALALRGWCLGSRRDFNAALASFRAAVAIEPNLSSYRSGLLECTVRSPSPWPAPSIFAEFQRLFPGEHDCDELGIQACLRCGQAARARELLQEAALPSARRESLATHVASACHVADLLHGLWVERRRDPVRPSDLLARLRAAHETWPDDPYLNTNLGFALRAAGEVREASRLLFSAAGAVDPRWGPHCLANAGYCYASLGDWERAEAFLSATLQAISRGGQAVQPLDVPGVADWLDPERSLVIETQSPSAASLLRPWMTNSTLQPRPSEEVRRLFGLLERAEANPIGRE